MIRTEIITDEARFKRLLLLELEDLCEFTDSDPELSITDADHITDRRGRFVICFGRGVRGDYTLEDKDVFLHRPFDMEELRSAVARLSETEAPVSPRVGLEIRDDKVYYNGDPVPFTETESSVFRYLYERRGSVVSRDEIKELIKRNKNAAESNSGDVYIRMIRKKLDDVYGVKIVRSSRGKGYYID